MTLFWKNAVPVLCGVVICGAAITWQVYKAKANEWKLTETARELTEAASVCRVHAEQGDAKAQYDLGSMCYYGKGVPQDYTEAARWYRKSAEQGDARSENGIGSMYELGLGVPLDYAEALRWYRKAADQGYAKAQINLGSMYYDGRGVPQDRAEAARWYRKAADRGLARAQYDLGYMYYYGQGVPQDRAEADRWYHKAADQGDEYAQRALGLKMSLCFKISYSVMFLGSLMILISSGLPTRPLRDRQQRTAILAGLLGISYVALSLFGFYHIGIRQSGSAVVAFYFAKSIMGGISIVMFLSIVWPESSKPKGAKIALEILGLLFIGFNIFAIAHHDLVRLASAIRIFCMVNGQLIGLSITLAIYLWRTHKQIRGEPNLNRENAAPEIPDESESESDQA
jgi:hypothetical protein